MRLDLFTEGGQQSSIFIGPPHYVEAVRSGQHHLETAARHGSVEHIHRKAARFYFCTYSVDASRSPQTCSLCFMLEGLLEQPAAVSMTTHALGAASLIVRVVTLIETLSAERREMTDIEF